jgi:alkaline phosphatase D
MILRTPNLGPIIGYTSDHQVRIWARGVLEVTESGPRRCFGAARVRPIGGNYGQIVFTKMTPLFDMTSVSVFENLQSETSYQYQVGYFYAETEMDNLDDTQDLIWDEIEPYTFKTGSANAAKARSYVFGSCRYLLRFFGGAFFDERGDKTFRSILDQINAGGALDGALMIGDQIYADDLNFVAPDTQLDQYLERYRLIFGQEWMRKLMQTTPTYMILDDHEIEDNWPENADDEDWQMLYPAAMHAYQIYQASHSPLFELDAHLRLKDRPDKWWYSFSDGCAEFFFTDCRTERRWSDKPSERRMLKNSQMDALLAWLKNGSNQVKIIVTSVPFFPDLKSESEDKWSGFIGERTRILDFIQDNQIQKVIFLSGDVHCSLTTQLTSPADPSFKILSVISSAFFWPYPHTDQSDFILKGTLKNSSKRKYTVSGISDVVTTDNFTRLDLTPGDVMIRVFKRKGEQAAPAVRHVFS